MPKVLRNSGSNWSGGVITALLNDTLPDNTVSRGWNSAFYDYTAGNATAFGKRRGAELLNTAPVTGAPAILENVQFKHLEAGGSLTLYHLLVSDTGRLDLLDTSIFTTTAADAGHATPFTSGTFFPDYDVANNQIFFVNGNAADQKKFDGTTVTAFGVSAPAAPTLTATGVGVMTGAYDVALTYYVSGTGLESSRSTFTSSAALATQQLKVDWVASSDTQVTHVRVYIRKPVLGSTFVLASSIAVGATTTTLNLSDSAINNLITPAPDTAQNNPPPTVNHLAWHYSRMFAADHNQVYYSQLGQPEAFDPNNFLRVNPSDGQRITGLLPVNGALFIFKTYSTYALVGSDPASWTLTNLSADIGCVSHRSIVHLENSTYWWSHLGPISYEGGQFSPIGQLMIPDAVDGNAINYAETDRICGAPDVANSRVIWAVPASGQTRNTLMLPFNYRLGRFESNKWDPLDACSLGSVEDSTGRAWVHIGGYAGRVSRLWSGDIDGARLTDGSTYFTLASTVAGTAFATNVLTDGAATFDTTGGGLTEVYLTVINNADSTDYQRRRIVSNTGTALTVLTNFTNIHSGDHYTYYIGGPDFQVDSRWDDAGEPFMKKRYEFLYMSMLGMSPSYSVAIDLFFNAVEIKARTINQTFIGSTSEALFDVALFDFDLWAGSSQQAAVRLRMGATGTNWRVTVRQQAPHSPAILTGLGMRAVLLTDKLG
jgi:hypothetical protein